jgi:uncharacterized surface protein with fasciclin (FAS1) repeats
MENNKSMILAVVAVLVLIGGGIGIYTMTQNNDEPTETAQITQPAEETETQESEAAPSSTIVELAVATDDLSTLVTAVTAADLVDTLSGEGPFTVFAPTNDAFAALPAGTVETLLLPENKAKLQAVLTYHVVAGKVMSSDLSNGQVVKTVQGNNLTVEIADGKVMLVDATGAKAEVVTADVEASNGVVHIINSVVLPE